ncbi:DNRLRE domain-containing protein [Clostridium sp. BJN0001]|uniref:DNRLRE domain-containing protein n=1 Tax=Clostridium sp. BJN0001 TaxID=2930219 RepID=UPI001FD01865|nr:DNRLRE domain-containing protein [Clostridium sp. BJN0001]
MLKSNITFNASDVTYVSSEESNKNFSHSQYLLSGLKKDETDSGIIIYKSLFKFNLTPLNNMQVKTAYLCFKISSIYPEIKYYRNNTFSLYKNLENYNYSTVTWNSFPKVDHESQIELNIGINDVGKYISINITNFINSWIKNKNNFGITLKTNSKNKLSVLNICSTTSSNPPCLIIL